MKPERWQELDRLFHSALGRTPAERAAFLDEACGGDESLREEVGALLSAHGEAGSFIERPALELEARSLADDRGESVVGQTIGHYGVISLLGAGGMGEVYRALDTRLGRQIALKILPVEFTRDADRVRRFQQEARAASALNHPNIITIYEIGQLEDRHFMATELIDGETLRRRISGIESLSGNGGKSAIPPQILETLNIAIQAADALAAAHEAGIVHRDIKPENIMVRSRDGYVKVLDFGLAKLTEGPPIALDPEAPTRIPIKTSAGLVMGTVTYMSPEQTRGETVDVRTDIWSLGVVLYEMLAGTAPFARATSSEVIALILEREPPPLTRYARDVPAELERIVSKALTKDREERYQTARDFLVDLRRLRQRLEVDAEIERTAQPEKSSEEKVVATSSEQTATATGGAATVETGAAAVAPSTLSAAQLVKEIKQHKRGALALAVVLVAASVVAYLAYARYAAGGRASTIRSVAVLPFANQTNDPDSEYLSDGISESLINSLSQLAGVKVIARSSSFKYKGKEVDPQEVASALGVEAILTGRVTQRGDNLLISVELMDARDKMQVWGEQYNRRGSDLLAVQSEISREIAEKLRLKLTNAEQQQLVKRPTENLKAFQYYMQGRAYTQRRTREDLLEAIRYCEKAIEEDRDYALAYAGLADAYSGLVVRGYIAPLEGRRKAEETARKALALDENLAEAHAALGQAYGLSSSSSFSPGDRELRRAIELSPSLAGAHQYLGLSLARQGRLDESLEEILKARELDPLSSVIARQIALPYYLKRDSGRALELLRSANELGPTLSTTWEIGVYVQNKLFNEALAELEKAKRERKSDPILIYSTGMVYAAQGKRTEALQIIKELEEMSGTTLGQAHWIAKVYAALNEKEQALRSLEGGTAAEVIAAFYKDEPVWDTIRGDPRFGDLLRRMNIPLSPS
jgi:eukaryotic-like serine/threonine-protein kinase